MSRYIIKRLLFIIPTLLLVAFIVLFIMDLTPSDPGTLILGDNAKAEDIEALNEELGYNDPFIVRYVRFIWDAVRGDLGESWQTGRSVTSTIAQRLPVTATLALGSLVFGSIIGILLGILSAVKQYSILDFFSTTLAMALGAFPSFWIGMMLILIFSLGLGWLPSFGAGGIKNFILPWATAGCFMVSSLLRMTRTSMLEAIRMDYIRTARAKGQTERKIITRHALRNALLPVVTVLGVSFGTMLAGTVTVETVFSLPGVGLMIIEGIRMKDVPVVTGATVVLAAMFTVLMLFVDILYAFIDPRIKARYAKK
ncbi:MAG: ABC transporter permease [Lachnospiraceae bacterium]|jgi:peptide/nickel transport system permease protein|nr:ABC transporter permease [Lachnospiraceae bacterium]